MSAPKFSRLVLGAAICCAALLQTGCAGRYTGGGYIDSIAGAPQKATFGFNINGIDLDGDQAPDVATGQFQFNDHGTRVSFHVDKFSRLTFGTFSLAIFHLWRLSTREPMQVTSAPAKS
jgi:hypothetical protein